MYKTPVYTRSPVRVQELLLSLRALLRNGIRLRSLYQEISNEISQTQWLDRDELRKYQEKRLKHILRSCLHNVPYVDELISGNAIDIEHFNLTEDLQRFPVISKSDILKNPAKFRSIKKSVFHYKGSTSGTSGSSLNIWHDYYALVREQAFVNRQLDWAGYRKNDPMAWIRGDLIVPVLQKKPPFWRYNAIDNQLMFSSYHLSEENIAFYIEALEEYDPVIIKAYPSSVAYLAKWLESRGRSYKGKNLLGIVTSSETLYDEDRVLLESVFGCLVYDWYGSYERVCSIGTCKEGSYHINMDYGIMEILNVENNIGQIVGTGINNLAMPLLRYDVGDLVELNTEGVDCRCGRSLPMVRKVLGRQDDCLITRSGRRIGRTGITRGIDGVLESQIVQVSRDNVIIKVVPSANYSGKVEQMLKNHANDVFAGELDVEVEVVDKLERTKSGKLKSVINLTSK